MHCLSLDAKCRLSREEPNLTMPDGQATDRSKRCQYRNARRLNRRQKSRLESAQTELLAGPLSGNQAEPESEKQARGAKHARAARRSI